MAPPEIIIEGPITQYRNPDLDINRWQIFSSVCKFYERTIPATTIDGETVAILGHSTTAVVTQKKVVNGMGEVSYDDVPMEGEVFISVIGTGTINGILASRIKKA